MTIPNSIQSKEMLCHHMVRTNDNYLGSAIKVCLFTHSTNTISPTDAKWANGMENMALVGSIG
jgi:hypothetical protein